MGEGTAARGVAAAAALWYNDQGPPRLRPEQVQPSPAGSQFFIQRKKG